MMKQTYGIVFILAITIAAGCGKDSGTGLPDQAKVEKTPAAVSEVAVQAAPAETRGSGTVDGTVTFSGAKPAPSAINMSADPNCANFYTDAVYSESVEGNAPFLKNAFVYIKSGLEGKSFPLPQDPVIIDQKGCVYHPHVVGVRMNQPVEMINSDSTLHNVHALPKNSKEFNLGMPIKGMRMKKTFEKPEVMVRLKCDVHPWMNAYAGVLEHPYFSVTGEDGKFVIKNVPAGTYTLAVWHETLGTLEQPITVTPEGILNPVFEYAS